MSDEEASRPRVRSLDSSSSSDSDISRARQRSLTRAALRAHGNERDTRFLFMYEQVLTPESDPSDWPSSENEDHIRERLFGERPQAASTSRPDGSTSDSSEGNSDGNSDKCSICLLRFTNQEIGTPESCEHIFCADCITEWSRNVNTCPVDRMTFHAIIVRNRVGGVALRKEPVRVNERRSSVDLMVFEEPTICELCRSAESEETMLLCDGCDLGYHMACLDPPLHQIPTGQWFCPNCMSDNEDLSVELADLFDDIQDYTGGRPLPARPHVYRLPRVGRSPNAGRRASNRRAANRAGGSGQGGSGSGQGGSSGQGSSEQGAGSSGQASGSGPVTRSRAANLPSTSRQGGSDNAPSTSRSSTSSRRAAPRPRRGRPRRRRRDVAEYDVAEGGKFPITTTTAPRRRVTKRKSRKRQPRTAARRTLVRDCVRARLASLHGNIPRALRDRGHDVTLRVPGPQLSIFGNPFELDFFSEGEGEGGGGGGPMFAVASRPTSEVLNAYRQARRKQVTIPSPSHAATAPDILSSILESQTLFHSKQSIVSVSIDGQVNIKLHKAKSLNPKPDVTQPKPDVTPSKPEETQPKTTQPKTTLPDAKDDKNLTSNEKLDVKTAISSSKQAPTHPHQARGNGHSSGYQAHYRSQGNFHNAGRNYDNNYRNDYNRNQGNSYQNHDGGDGNYEGGYDRRPINDGFRPRRPNYDENRFQRFNEPGRHSFGPPWQPFNNSNNRNFSNRNMDQNPRARHSFGGFENPLDMRTGPNNHQVPTNSNFNTNQRIEPLVSSNVPPLPEPPTFKLNLNTEVDKSEDENDGLVIDTEKYDPMEPTVDEESGDESAIPLDKPDDVSQEISQDIPQEIPMPLGPVPNQAKEKPVVSEAVLDNAVRQVLSRHTKLLSNSNESDDDDAGDCPNFSIYSATSVHIAHTSQESEEQANAPKEKETVVEDPKKLVENQYNEKVSKRCPITPNTRHPIKIKLNTPSLIKRVTLYDEEDIEEPMAEDIVEESKVDEKSDVEQQESVIDQDIKTPVRDEKFDDDKIVEKVSCDKNNAIPQEKNINNDKHVESSIIESDEVNKKAEKIVNSVLSKILGRDSSDDETSIKSTKSLQSINSANSLKSDKSKHSQGESESDNYRKKSEKKKSPAEKMTESISETEDERSYTPCLDENKSKDNSLETAGLVGLDTELISEDEAQDTFPDPPKESPPTEKEPPKKKRKETKEKKTKKKAESFKKSGKAKSRNYRDKDKHRSRSPSNDRAERKKREKRKDLERYDVRNVVTDKRRRKDAFGRDIVSPTRSVSPTSPRARRSISPQRLSPLRPRRSTSRPRRSPSRSRRSISRNRRSLSRVRQSPPRLRRSISRSKRSPSRSRRSISRKRSLSRPRRSVSRQRRSLSRLKRSVSRHKRSLSRQRRSLSRKRSPGRRGSVPRGKRRYRSKSRTPTKRRLPEPSPPPPRKKKKSVSPRRKSPQRKEKKRKDTEAKSKPTKKKKRDRSQSKEKKRSKKKNDTPKRKSPKRKKAKKRSPVVEVEPEWVWSGESMVSVEEKSPSLPPEPETPRVSHRHRRARDPPPSKEVFTSGDNILVSVSFKEGGSERRRRGSRRGGRGGEGGGARPVAIIDLDNSPFREITPEDQHVIVVSDGEKSPDERRDPVGPKTPPDNPPVDKPVVEPAGAPSPPSSPDAYDPFEPTRSPSPPAPAPPAPAPGEEATPPAPSPPAPAPAPSPAAPEPALAITLETAQKTNLSADDVVDQRPISPIEKVMALLKSTHNVSPERVPASCPSPRQATPPPAPAPPSPPAAPPRVLLPSSPARASPLRPQPAKLFLAKPSPIKSTPIKPMPATKISSLPLPPLLRRDDSPYSPASSDFGELFSPPGGGTGFDALMPRRRRHDATKVPVKRVKKKGRKHQVGMKLDEDNLRILDELPSSAVEMQVKSKFLRKLNRQERVVEEVKLVLKPHYNKKRLSKDEYKDIMRRAVPKICHNKTGEINPSKIQSLVEAYVKKIRKKRKLGLA